MLNLDSFPLHVFDMGVGGVTRRLPSFPLHLLMYVFVCMYYCHTETSLMSVLVSWALSSFFTCPLLPSTPLHSCPLNPPPPTPHYCISPKGDLKHLLRFFGIISTGSRWYKIYRKIVANSEAAYCAWTTSCLRLSVCRLTTCGAATKASTPDSRLLYWACSLLLPPATSNDNTKNTTHTVTHTPLHGTSYAWREKWTKKTPPLYRGYYIGPAARPLLQLLTTTQQTTDKMYT